MLWVEKYRPKTVKQTILPKKLKSELLAMLEKKEIPHCLFSGKSGVGKTTVARAIANELGMDMIFINGSDDRNIDVLRTKIRGFASTISLTPGLKKLVIIDEADYLNPTSTQPALRGFIEEFEGNCRFIFTCNYANKLIEAIRSRCQVFDFVIPPEERETLQMDMFVLAQDFLAKEGIQLQDPKVLAELVFKYTPDWRKVIGELQRYSVNGTLDTGIFANATGPIDGLIKAIRSKAFNDARKWIGENSSLEPTQFYRALFDAANGIWQNGSLAQALVTIGEYHYRSAFVVDHEINNTACIIELMKL